MTDLVPGLYQAVDAERLHVLRSQHEHLLTESRQNGQLLSGRKQEYETLRGKLLAIANQPGHEVMVPLGKKAFLPARLVHTNEILVLLGENWFVERSARQAAEIVDRRIARCDDMLQKRAEEFRLFDSWRKETDQLTRDLTTGEGAMEIREPYDEEEEERWREEHRRRVSDHRRAAAAAGAAGAAGGTSADDDDDDLWRRLEQLEIEEELDEHLAAETLEAGAAAAADDVEDWSSEDESEEATSESDDESCDEAVAPKLLKRRVSFGGTTNHELEAVTTSRDEEDIHTNVIEVTHSENKWERSRDNASTTTMSQQQLMTPADLEKRFVTPERVKRSILKPFDSASIKISDTVQQQQPDLVEYCSEPTVQAVGDLILEKEVSVVAEPIPSSSRKQSKFKQSRSNK